MLIRTYMLRVFLSSMVLLAGSATWAQRTDPDVTRRSDSLGSVPRLMKFADTLKDSAGTPRGGAVGLTFAIYAEREGGSPLWMETQNVLADDDGRFSALLGAATRGGLPADLFAGGEPRWLGVHAQIPGEAEQARVLLVSVPYAMKAADADTLGGRPASDYVLREQVAGWSGVLNGGVEKIGNESRSSSGGTQAIVSGTINRIGKFTPTGADVGNSQLFDDGVGVGLGTTSPASLFDVQLATATARDAMNTGVTLNNSAPINSAVVTALRMVLTDQSTNTNLSKQAMRATYIRSATATGGVSAFDSTFTLSSFFDANAPYQFRSLNVEGPRVAAGRTLQTLFGLYIEAPPALGGAVTNRFAMVTEPGAGNVGIGTTNPLHLLEVSGGNIKLTGVGNALIFPDGTVMTSATPGVGGGTISGVTAGAGLVGGGTSGGVTLAANLTGSGGDNGTGLTVSRGDHLHDGRYLRLAGGALTGALTSTANISTTGTFQSGSAAAAGRFSTPFFAPGAGTTLLGAWTSSSLAGPQERFEVTGNGNFADIGLDSAQNFVVETNDTVRLTVNRATGEIRVPGHIRLGSESGTAEAPAAGFSAYSGLVVRRLMTADLTSGGIVARSNDVTLERDGSVGGFRVQASSVSSGGRVLSCFGVTDTGATLGTTISISTANTPVAVFTNAQNVVFMKCAFGHPFAPGHTTEVTLVRQPGDLFWTGTVTSTFNQ